jgi:hypothetical protein
MINYNGASILSIQLQSTWWLMSPLQCSLFFIDMDNQLLPDGGRVNSLIGFSSADNEIMHYALNLVLV